MPPEPVACAWADKRRSDRQRSATTIHSLRGFDVETEVEFTLPRRHPLRGGFSSSSSTSSCADSMCSISREPRRDEYTIWTAVAPEAVFTVRTYGATTESLKAFP